MDAPDLFQNPLRRWLAGPKKPATRPTVLVKELHERDRRRVLRHFLALESSDRLLRFGNVLSDEAITDYVHRIDFVRDMVYGVYNSRFAVVGLGHLAFAAKDAAPEKHATTVKDRIAEFGVSVSKSMRGMGVGSALFERAAIHCRNNDVDTLYMQCLSSNRTMMHIARKAGMEIERDHGEADAHLRLLPPNPASIMQEAVQEQFASLDYTLKANVRAAFKLFSRFPGRKG